MKPLRIPPLGAAVSLAVLLLVTGVASAKSAFLGIQMQELNEALLEALDLGDGTRGVLVADVVEGSAAEQAGIERGDVILSVDGHDVDDQDELMRRISALESGDEIEIEIHRDGRKRKLDVTLGEAPERERMGHAPRVFEWRGEAPDGDGENMFFLRSARPQLGLRLEELGEQLGEYFGSDSGLLVLEVFEDSAAEKAGIQVGDVIRSVDGEQLDEVQQLLDILGEREDGDELAITVLRDRKSTELTATVEEAEELDFGRHMLRLPRGGRDFQFFSPRGHGLHREDMPRFRMHGDDELREELDRLREQLEDLREEISELRRG